jgi:hypothetical protein
MATHDCSRQLRLCLGVSQDRIRRQTFSITLFGLGLSGRAEDAAFERFVRASQIDESKITQDILNDILELYPANTKQLPFSTGDSLFDRAAAWSGDSMFLSARRRFTAAAAKHQPVFSYLFTEFVPGDSPKLGGKRMSYAMSPACLIAASLPCFRTQALVWTRSRLEY